MTSDVTPALARFLAALDESAVDWCVLRDEDILAEPDGDVDLLIRQEHMSRVDSVAERLGYTRLLLWGHGPRSQYVCFSSEAGNWLKIDAVWRLDFGRVRRLRTNLAEECLERRDRLGTLNLLQANDRFWVLLLHCLLDKDSISSRHVAAMARTIGRADVESPSGRFVRELVGEEEVQRALEAVRRSDNVELLETGRRWEAGLRTQSSLKRAAPVGGRVLRSLGRRVRGIRNPGPSVAVVDETGNPNPALLARIADLESRPAFTVVRMNWPGGRPGMAGRRPLSAWVGWFAALRHRLRGHVVLLEDFGAVDLRGPARPGLPRPPNPVVVVVATDAERASPHWAESVSGRVVPVASAASPPAAVMAVAGILGR